MYRHGKKFVQLFVGVDWVCAARCFGMKKGLRNPEGLCIHNGGDEGDRTPDLLTASQALSQLSYAPVRKSTIRELPRRCKDNFGKTFAGAALDGLPGPGRDPPRPACVKTMPVYYDESGLCDHTRLFAKLSSVLPAVLLAANLACSEVIDSS